ncbi:hypothetical protein BDW02DRAFT_584306 [Decorospora gaudefroyi]|uniref:RBR-type E3 ubiquitin transferase n=1 Tax=Decorospora gaudefroyi TaxID=184978 RepID=A0A6A5K2H3_9PLEO|nr:hypothetical protein BDW02DRAFT_584306 [Decorospora gaudefroyi]
MSKSCVICGSNESECELLLSAPCGSHWVCTDDVASFFENATNNESLFPPKCCDQMFMLADYAEYVPVEMAWAYQVKEQGEYAILARFRTYCANRACAKFLHPASHIKDPKTSVTYAICEAEDCGLSTCVECKQLLEEGTRNHECKQNEDDKRFKQMATEKGYQECSVCGATVELAEACNHITCECGNAFCYICGEDWPGLHSCPHYGPPIYDEEGYNQDGFHRETGLNRDGLDRHLGARGEGEDPDDDGEREDREEEDADWEIMQHMTPDQRDMVNQLPFGPREDALDQMRIELFEIHGILFNRGHPPPPPPQGEGEVDDLGNDEDGEDTDDALAVHDGIDEAGDVDGGDTGQDSNPDTRSEEEEDEEDALDDGSYFIDEEAIQGHQFADEHWEDNTPDLGSMFIDIDDTPLPDWAQAAHDSSDAAAMGPSSAASPTATDASHLSYRPEFDMDFLPDSTTHMLGDVGDSIHAAGHEPTGVVTPPYTVVAHNFPPGTSLTNIESVVTSETGVQVLACLLISVEPTMVVELLFENKEEAEKVVERFHGQVDDGSTMSFFLKGEEDGLGFRGRTKSGR